MAKKIKSLYNICANCGSTNGVIKCRFCGSRQRAQMASLYHVLKYQRERTPFLAAQKEPDKRLTIVKFPLHKVGRPRKHLSLLNTNS